MTISELVGELEEALEHTGEINRITMMESTNVIARISSLVLGMLAIIIVALVPVIIALELIYICFPVIREKVEEFFCKMESIGIKNNPLGFTLRDAREAVEQAATVDTGQSALLIYMKLKCKSVMMVMFVVALVLRGPAFNSVIEDIFVGVIEKIVNVLRGF